jgi:hypothetical protein
MLQLRKEIVETAAGVAVQNRRLSQICRLERVAGCRIIGARRTNSAHLHRPWRAITRHWTLEVPLLSAEMPGLRDQIDPLVELPHHNPEGTPVFTLLLGYQSARDLPRMTGGPSNVTCLKVFSRWWPKSVAQ